VTAQTESITRFAQYFLTREKDAMSSYAEDIETERYDAMQKFNRSNGFDLDAQPTDRDPEAITLYSERGDTPEVVVSFETVSDFEQWVSLIGHVDDEDVPAIIDTLINMEREAAQRRAFATYVYSPSRHLAPVCDLRDAFETLTEKSAA